MPPEKNEEKLEVKPAHPAFIDAIGHEAETDITVTVMTKEKLREFIREEVRKALAEVAHEIRMSAGVRHNDES